MSISGVGDQWLRGEALPGVAFQQYAPVTITSGPRTGQAGVVLLLVALEPEPTFLVALEDAVPSVATGSGPAVRVAQSALAAR